MSNQRNQPSTLPPAVQTVLDELRLRFRRYIWMDGSAAALIWLGVAFWTTLAIDWFFEPAVWVRAILLGTIALVLTAILILQLVRRLLVRITDANAATILERRFPELGDSLLTTVVLSDRTQSTQDLDLRLLASTRDEASARCTALDASQAFQREPLRQKLFAVALLLLSIAIFTTLFWSASTVWARRTLALSHECWPRKTRLTVEGFAHGPKKIARGADLEILAKADASMPLVPASVEVRYRTDGGSRGRATMDRRGIAHPPEDAFQEYAYTFASVLGDIHFDVVGGDDRVNDCWIQVVDSPTISEMTLDCQLPSYIGRKPLRLPVSGVMQVPMGSRVTVLAGGANKKLTRVEVSLIAEERTETPRAMPDAQLNADQRGFRYAHEALFKDAALFFTLTDADSIRNRDAIRLVLSPTPDQPPQMSVQLDGIGSAITPKATIPVAGHITDDYGIGRVWFENSLDDKKQGRQNIGVYAHRPTELDLTGNALEIQDLQLHPGQKLAVSVKAADLCDLGRTANVASSERWILEIVTPEQLRAMLEARELILRQRFERMIQEMTETADLLTKLELGRPHADQTSKPPTSAKPGDDEPDDSPERRHTLRVLRVEGMLTNCRKSTQEVLGLAEAFEDIQKQLVNNRIDTEEWKQRLQLGIAAPLRTIGNAMFPEWERRIDALRPALDDAKQGPILRDRAKEQALAIVAAMLKVRDKMIEMEDFNEALDLLRGIIQGQQQLRDQTQQHHKNKIRDLMKD